jgi:tartrate-resistant acid phosphatase type 5
MWFVLRTFLGSPDRAPRFGRRRLGPSSIAALLALCTALFQCEGDTTVGGTSDTGLPPRSDGALDIAQDDRAGDTGETGNGRPEAGDPEISGEDRRIADATADLSEDAQTPHDAPVDAAEEPVDPPRDASDETRDASLDVEADASLDALDGGTDAPADVPRDTGPIVVGPPYWRSVRFAVFGDYGMASTDEARVSNLVHSWNVDFILTTGDNNYTGLSDGIDGVIGRYYSDFIGNYWGTYGPGSRTTRFWPSPGNHDWDVGDLSAYIDYFTLPGNERYYDINLGLVHLFAVDSDPREPDGTTADSVQGRWLQGRLAQSTSCFKVVYFHHPSYSSGPHGSSLEMRWPFEQWGADVVLAGHDHVYERFEVGQIPYFTVGLGGGGPYAFVTTIPESRAQFNSDFGAMRVTANRRGMRFEFIDANGTTVESFDTRKRCR